MRTLKKAFLILCCCSLFCQADGHVFVLQGIAWAKMFYSFAQKDSLKVAFHKTFDGEHPCEVCLRLARLQAKSSQIKTVSLDLKIKIFDLTQVYKCVTADVLLITYPDTFYILPQPIYFSPLTPPPRFV